MKPFISMVLFVIGFALLTLTGVYFTNMCDFATRTNAPTVVYVVYGILGVVSLIFCFRTLLEYFREADK